MILFKYLNPERIDVLKDKKIRFTQPIFLNDKFEALPNFEQIITKKGFDTHLIPFIGPIDIVSIIKNSFPLLSNEEAVQLANNPYIQNTLSEILPLFFGQIKELLTESHSKWSLTYSNEFKKAASKKIGILSLSEIWNNQSMWAHYARDNKGFVIAFDSDNDFFDQRNSLLDELKFVQPVTYSKQRPKWPTIDLQSNETDFSSAINLLLLTKHIDWETEKEWRMILPLENANSSNNEIYLFRYPANCIKEIILGSDIEKNLKEDIIKLIKNDEEFSHVKISQIYLSNSYLLERIEVL